MRPIIPFDFDHVPPRICVGDCFVEPLRVHRAGPQMERFEHPLIFALGEQHDRLMALARHEDRRAIIDGPIHEVSEALAEVGKADVDHLY